MRIAGMNLMIAVLVLKVSIVYNPIHLMSYFIEEKIIINKLGNEQLIFLF